mmetsp:Transcript_34694/g.68033  ORF Transcript_34694/g.68033 Transcript_34694/m.68033 type:complete len:108 (-) Transcript_34694:528-851(-)
MTALFGVETSLPESIGSLSRAQRAATRAAAAAEAALVLPRTEAGRVATGRAAAGARRDEAIGTGGVCGEGGMSESSVVRSAEATEAVGDAAFWLDGEHFLPGMWFSL